MVNGDKLKRKGGQHYKNVGDGRERDTQGEGKNGAMGKRGVKTYSVAKQDTTKKKGIVVCERGEKEGWGRRGEERRRRTNPSSKADT